MDLELLSIIIISGLILVILALLWILNKKENMMKNKQERFDLEAITKNISENYKPVSVRLTTYEQEQEDNAIISYEELVNKMNASKINYDNSYIHDESDIEVRKIEVDKEIDEEKEFVSNKTSRFIFDPAAILPEPAELKRYNIDDLLADDDLDDASGIK